MANDKYKNPEDDYLVTLTDEYVQVIYPDGTSGRVNWNEIAEIKIRTTNEGPFLPDVWLILIGKDTTCSIPQGAGGYDEVYDIVSKYEGFSFEQVIKSMTCTDNAEFELWKRK